MNTDSRYWAFAAYVLSLPGALLVLVLRPSDPFAHYHAKQSLTIAFATVLTPLLWAVIAWMLAYLVPVIGPMLGVMLFALVLAALVGLLVSWIIGMVYALQGRLRPVPLVGHLAERRQRRPSRFARRAKDPLVIATNAEPPKQENIQ
jgi:uncharacterized membrane protein